MLADTSNGDYCTQTFVALDKWLQQAASEKGTGALKAVKSAFENNIDVNITYYEIPCNRSGENWSIAHCRPEQAACRLVQGPKVNRRSFCTHRCK
jgi:hypothetical protein